MSRILVVEDEFILADDIASRLVEFGYGVAGKAASAQAAIDLAESTRPDLVLMDIHLDGPLDGIYAAREIRRRFSLPVVFLTAFSEDSTLQQAKEAEPFGYILKPFEDRELRTSIEIALYKHKADMDIRRLTRLYATLSQVNQAIVRNRTREELFPKICEIALEFGKFQVAWIASANGSTGELVPVAAASEHAEIAGPPDCRCPCGLAAIQENRSCVTNSLWTSRPEACRQVTAKLGLQACATFPIHFHDQVWGVLTVGTNEPDFFNHAEIHLLTEIAMDISFALDALDSERRRQESEALLRRSEEQSRTILRTALDGFCVLDTHGTFLQVNDAYCRMSGYSREELLRLRVHDLKNSAGEQEADDNLQTIMSLGEARFESRQRRKDGSEILLEVSASFQNTDPGRCICFLRDITKQKQSESRLASLATAIEQAGEEIVITGLDGAITYCNPAFEQITGYSRDEVLGQNPRVLKSGLQTPEFYEQLWHTITHGKLWSGRFINRKKDGSLFHEDATIAPICDAAGKTTGFVAVKRDVTEQIALQEQLLQSQKLESVGRLAGCIAHDFNNLLTVIGGYGEVLLKRLPDGDPSRRPVTQICLASDRAGRLTKQLLAFSRKQLTTPKSVDLNQVIGDLEDMLQGLIGEDIELQTTLEPCLGKILADRGQLVQVVMNLVVNARDAMPTGGRLTIRTANTELELALAAAHPEAKPGAYVLLAVTDNGIGMDEEVRRHIFEPFFTTKSEGAGTGLGLSTVYGAVRQFGGWISVQSQPQQGSTFSIFYPQTDAPLSEEEPSLALPENLLGSETVLVVEDRDDVRRLTVETLSSYGYQVLEAPDGGDALMLAARHSGPIHLLVTDVVMPGLTGKELADNLRSVRPRMRILYMSGYPKDAFIHRGVFPSDKEYLAKPFSANELAMKVREILGSGPLPLKILVADDEEGIRHLLREILNGAGYEVAVAGDGESALCALRREKFDLLLTDLVMPNREGIETILAARKECADLKIIAISGAFGGSVLQAAQALGASATLAKPVSPEQLLSTIEEVLRA